MNSIYGKAGELRAMCQSETGATLELYRACILRPTRELSESCKDFPHSQSIQYRWALLRIANFETLDLTN
jgi:hypothetical protein